MVLIYLHIKFQLKVNNNLEVYEIDYISNEYLQKMCDIRLPVLFNSPFNDITSYVELKEFTKTQKSLEINIYEINDKTIDYQQIPLQLSYNAGTELIKDKKYYSMNNNNFLEDTNLKQEFRKNDELLKPYLTVEKKYDLIIGSNNLTTPFQYHMNYRNFIYVSKGNITIKFTSMKSKKYLNPITDIENQIVYSKMDVWCPQCELEMNYEKINFVEVSLERGKCIYIPPYCWYSIRFNLCDEVCCLQSYSYRSYMNVIALSPLLIRNVIKKICV